MNKILIIIIFIMSLHFHIGVQATNLQSDTTYYYFKNEGLEKPVSFDDELLILISNGTSVRINFRGTSDEFDDAREGYLPGFIALEAENVDMKNGVISFSLNTTNRQFVNRPILLTTETDCKTIPEGYRRWIQMQKFYQKVVPFDGTYNENAITLVNKSTGITKTFSKESYSCVKQNYNEELFSNDYAARNSVGFSNIKKIENQGKAIYEGIIYILNEIDKSAIVDNTKIFLPFGNLIIPSSFQDPDKSGVDASLNIGNEQDPQSIDNGISSTTTRSRSSNAQTEQSNGNAYTVTAISDTAFLNCQGLIRLTIPNSVTKIGKEAFRGCNNLTSVGLSLNLKEISSGLFRDCEKLEEINIPSGVLSLGSNAFLNCKSLNTIIIPSSMSKLESGVFSGCHSLRTVKCYATTVPELCADGKSFIGLDQSQCQLFVPQGCAHMYREAKGWKEFKEIIESDSLGSNTGRHMGERESSNSSGTSNRNRGDNTGGGNRGRR